MAVGGWWSVVIGMDLFNYARSKWNSQLYSSADPTTKHCSPITDSFPTIS
jgi:hypothetical protein